MTECEHYTGGGQPSPASIVRHACELARRGSRPADELGVDIKIKWCSHGSKKGAATVDIYRRELWLFHAYLEPGWENDDNHAKIHADFIAGDESWAEPFMEINCGYVAPSIAPTKRP